MAQLNSPLALKAFYDGSCPLCQREVRFYRKFSGAEQISWIDISAVDQDDVAPGLSCDAAMKRFHVETAEGELLSGANAFAAIWSIIPAFKALGWLAKTPFFLPMLEWVYEKFLFIRPKLQRWLA